MTQLRYTESETITTSKFKTGDNLWSQLVR